MAPVGGKEGAWAGVSPPAFAAGPAGLWLPGRRVLDSAVLAGPGWWETSTRPEGQGPGPAAARGLSGARHTCVSALPGGGPLSVAGRGQSPSQRPPRGVLSAGCGPWVPPPAPGCAPSGRSPCRLLGAEDTCLTPRRDPERGRGPRRRSPRPPRPPRAVGQEARSGLKIAKNIRPRAAGPRGWCGRSGAPSGRAVRLPARAPLGLLRGPAAGPAPACRSGRFPASSRPRGPRPRRFHFCVSLAPGSARGRRRGPGRAGARGPREARAPGVWAGAGLRGSGGRF